MNFDKKAPGKATNKATPCNKPINQVLPLQKKLSLIEHKIEGVIIPQRPVDGYINATAMCKKADKLFNDYSRLATTKNYLSALSTATGIPVARLIQTLMGGRDVKEQGTWVHPKVAIHLAQWLSPEFAVQVTEWVFDWMHGTSKGYMPNHVKRYMANRAKIPPTHFSILNEIYLHLIAPLEDSNFSIPDKMLPDISTGKMFSGFLRKMGLDVDDFPTYPHEFLDNKRPVVRARLYPLELLEKFRDYFYNEWLPNHAVNYFSKRAPMAVPYIEQIIAELPAPPKNIEKKNKPVKK